MIVTVDTLHEVVSRLEVDGDRGLDTETTGLSEDDSLFSIIISDDTGDYYFNFNNAPETPDEAILPRAETMVLLRSIFANPRNEWYIHNAKFDWRMIAKEALDIAGRVHCTYAIERVYRNNYYTGKEPYGLAECAKRRGLQKDEAVEKYITEHKLWTPTTVPGKKKIIKLKHFEKVPFTIMAPYGTNDAVLHKIIGRDQKAKIAELSEHLRHNPLTPVYENEIRLTKTCYRMERRGVRIDKPRTALALEYELNQINEAEKEFERLTGEPFNDGPKTLQRVFDKFGAAYPTTDKGNPSFAAKVLEDMDSPIANLVNRIRHHEKRAGTYYSSFIHYATKDDIIHADCRQAGTEPGRMSYRDPNLQNVPKEDDPEDLATPYHVRECFVPRPGHFFYSVDYEQMEYRMMLDYAGEMRLIKAVMEGADVHQATAEMVGISRKHAKTLNFAILYGAGIDKIAKMLGVSKAEACDLKAVYFGRLPKVQQLINQVRDKGRERGYVINWFGRRCYIADPSWAYVLPNHLIQGGCADVVKIAMNQIDELLIHRYPQVYTLLQVHDELLIEPPFGMEDVIDEIRPIMENVYQPRNGMKLTTSCEHSFKTWGIRDKLKGKPSKVA